MLFLTDQFIPRPSSGNLTCIVEAILSPESDVFGEEKEEEVQIEGINEEENQYTPYEILNSSSSSANGASRNVPKTTTKPENITTTKTKTGYIKRVTPQTVIGQKLLEIEKEKLTLRQKKSAIDNPNDEDIGFFNSLLPHVRQLTPRDKLCFRMEVQNSLYSMLYNQQEPRLTSSVYSPQPSTSTSATSYDFNYEDAVQDPKAGNYYTFE